MQPSEFWSMPLFMLFRLAEKNSDKKQLPSRAEVLDGMRYRKERFGWV